MQALRQTLLQRSSSKNHMEQVDEESEARLIQVRVTPVDIREWPVALV